MFKNWIQEQIILPLSDLITGQQVRKYLTFMLKSQYWTREQIDGFQNERLRKLIQYAYENVPYYHDVMVERNLKPEDIQTKADLVKLPIISKEVMRKEGIERFTSKKISKKGMHKHSSSGSTGQPFVYYGTNLNYSVNLAANLRGWYNFGWRLGDRFMKISQFSRKSTIKKIQDFMTGNCNIPCNDLSEENIRRILLKIEKYKPVVIRSYPDPIYLIAQYRLKHQDEFSYCPKIITTTGNVLHTRSRQIIEEAFQCQTFDAYACEGNANVFECYTHECYHVSEEYGITEIVDDNGNPIIEGAGRVVTTDLWNYAHPFIRYDVQDRVEIETKPCSCGRAHMQIRKILGRDNECCTTIQGETLTGHHFTTYFNPAHTPELKDSIEQFQAIQHKDKSVTFSLVVNERYNADVAKIIVDYWSRKLGVKVDIKVVDRIPMMKNNKCKFIVVEK